MYVPPSFREPHRETLLRAIERQGFGLLVTPGDGADESRARLTPVPFRVERGRAPTLLTHLARANPQARAIVASPGLAVTAFFLGPHAYVSPRWLDGVRGAVPTWSYVAVEVRGHARAVTDPARVERELRALAAAHEGPDGWHPGELEPASRERLQAAVTLVEIGVDGLDGAWKLGQNRPARARAALARRLRAGVQPPPPALELAGLVEATLPRAEGGVTPRRAWAARLRTWRRRARTRAELARLDARALHDLGLRAEDAAREARKPFWRS